MSTPSTQTPLQDSPSRIAVRRSVTVPNKFQNADTRTSAVEVGAAEGIETLFVHPSARVVSFSTAASAQPSPTRGSKAGSERSALSWTSPTERTLAAGLLEIYRVPGSVSFLHSGSLLHAILPRSQCWCVDGVSVFVFRVLPNQYYRIELPGTTEDDLKLVERMKLTLQKVLHYERTACPFRRGFSVELPEAPPIFERKKLRHVSGPAKRWTLKDIWRPEDDGRRGLTPLQPDVETPTNAETGSIFDRLAGVRSVTSPPGLTVLASPSSEPVHEETTKDMPKHVMSPPRPSTPPAQLLGNIQLPLSPTSPPGAFSEDDIVENRIWTGISTPSLSSDSEGQSGDDFNSPPQTLRMRKIRNAHKASEISTPTLQASVQSGSKETPNALTDSIVRRTVSVVLGPPANLVSLMLKIASRFSNGAFNFTIKSPIGSPRKVPGSWYLGDNEDEWDFDDDDIMGSPLASSIRRREARSGGSSSD